MELVFIVSSNETEFNLLPELGIPLSEGSNGCDSSIDLSIAITYSNVSLKSLSVRLLLSIFCLKNYFEKVLKKFWK
jgi:hypothetical protein